MTLKRRQKKLKYAKMEVIAHESCSAGRDELPLCAVNELSFPPRSLAKRESECELRERSVTSSFMSAPPSRSSTSCELASSRTPMYRGGSSSLGNKRVSMVRIDNNRSYCSGTGTQSQSNTLSKEKDPMSVTVNFPLPETSPSAERSSSFLSRARAMVRSLRAHSKIFTKKNKVSDASASSPKENSPSTDCATQSAWFNSQESALSCKFRDFSEELTSEETAIEKPTESADSAVTVETVPLSQSSSACSPSLMDDVFHNITNSSTPPRKIYKNRMAPPPPKNPAPPPPPPIEFAFPDLHRVVKKNNHNCSSYSESQVPVTKPLETQAWQRSVDDILTEAMATRRISMKESISSEEGTEFIDWDD